MSLFIACCLFSQHAFSQEKETVEEEAKPVVFPVVEDVTLTTKDGVLLRCTWYPGQKKKESIPIVLLHGWGENRKVYKDFAEMLQKDHGYAVLIPDLRGHGDSTKTTDEDEVLSEDRFTREEIMTVREDIEQCRRFLEEKNNAEELNLELLSIVAAEETGSLAMAWANSDWSWPDLAGQKQGKFVKALVLLSPPKNFQGIIINTLADTPVIAGDGVPPISMLLAVGKGTGRKTRVARDLQAFHATVKRLRPVVRPVGDTPEKRKFDQLKKTTLFHKELSTSKQGVELLKDTSFTRYVTTFLKLRLLNSGQDYKWHEIRKP